MSSQCHASPPPPLAIAPPPSSSSYRAFLISDGAGRPKRRQIWQRIKPPPPLLLRPPHPSSSSGQRGVELANVDLVVGNLDLLSGGADLVVGRWLQGEINVDTALPPLPSPLPSHCRPAPLGRRCGGGGRSMEADASPLPLPNGSASGDGWRGS